MALIFRDRVLVTSTTTGTGTYTLGSAVTGYQAFDAVGDGNSCYYSAFETDANGNPSGGWEVGLGLFTLSGTTLARTAILYSSNSNNAVNWGAGTRRIAIAPVSLQGNVAPQSLAGGRLTLADGYPVYNPQTAGPLTTDTGTEVVTFSDPHGWVTGTMLTPVSSSGGLTAGTIYFINALSATTCAFYASLANAEADSSRINLTGNVTSNLAPFGVQSTNVRYEPFIHDMLGVPSPNGLTWGQYSIGSGLTLALGTKTSGGLYDIFGWINAGVLELIAGPAWASSTSRGTGAGTTEITLLNGRRVNAVAIASGPGANCGVLLGTVEMVSTTATEDSEGGVVSQVGAKRYVGNADNLVLLSMSVLDKTDSWVYSTATVRQANGAAGNQIQWVSSVGGNNYSAACRVICVNDGNLVIGPGIGLDSTNTYAPKSLFGSGASAAAAIATGGQVSGMSPIGHHALVWLERGGAAGTTTWYGDVGVTYGQSGLVGGITI